MSEREELEAVIERAVDQALDIAGQTGGFPPFREKIATALINSGYTKGNGELVEAVRAEQSEKLRRDVGYAVAQYRNLIRLHTKGEPILLRIVEERLSGNHDAADKLFDLLNSEEDNSHE
jgi:hypothetical protein